MKIIIFSFFIFLLTFTTASSIGVSPARIDFGILSKEVTFEREFTIFNTQGIETSYFVYITHYKDWFEFIPDKVSVPSGQSTNVKVIVNIPQNVNSDKYNINIYIKQIPDLNNEISMSPAVAIKSTLFVADKNDELRNNNISLSLREIKLNLTKETQNKANRNEKSENNSLFKINSNVIKQNNQQNIFAEIDTKGLMITASIFLAGILLHTFKKTEPFEL